MHLSVKSNSKSKKLFDTLKERTARNWREGPSSSGVVIYSHGDFSYAKINKHKNPQEKKKSLQISFTRLKMHFPSSVEQQYLSICWIGTKISIQHLEDLIFVSEQLLLEHQNLCSSLVPKIWLERRIEHLVHVSFVLLSSALCYFAFQKRLIISETLSLQFHR